MSDGRVDRDLGERRGDPAGQEEQEEPEPPEPVLDVVPEDPQVEHVAADVEPSAVEEQVGDEGEHGNAQDPAAPKRIKKADRDHPEGAQEGVEGVVAAGRLFCQFEAEDGEADPNDRERHHGPASGRVRVPEGDQACGRVIGSGWASASSWASSSASASGSGWARR
jgi:hypothetical protein